MSTEKAGALDPETMQVLSFKFTSPSPSSRAPEAVAAGVKQGVVRTDAAAVSARGEAPAEKRQRLEEHQPSSSSSSSSLSEQLRAIAADVAAIKEATVPKPGAPQQLDEWRSVIAAGQQLIQECSQLRGMLGGVEKLSASQTTAEAEKKRAEVTSEERDKVKAALLEALARNAELSGKESAARQDVARLTASEQALLEKLRKTEAELEEANKKLSLSREVGSSQQLEDKRKVEGLLAKAAAAEEQLRLCTAERDASRLEATQLAEQLKNLEEERKRLFSKPEEQCFL